MITLLNIDTATPHASVCLSMDDSIIALKENDEQKEHASFIHTAIQAMLREAEIGLNDIDGVAVTSGPGSYTGLRVGLSSAKGFCYALNKPLICVNTLEIMALASMKNINSFNVEGPAFFCPMIDARRMEVFTALYDIDLKPLIPPRSLILEAGLFEPFLNSQPVIFSGDGSSKFKAVVSHKNCHFVSVQHSAADLAALAIQSFKSGKFENLAYKQPEYFKEFFTVMKNGL